MVKAKPPVKVVCKACRHQSQIAQESEVWKCSCHATRDDCDCDHTNGQE